MGHILCCTNYHDNHHHHQHFWKHWICEPCLKTFQLNSTMISTLCWWRTSLSLNTAATALKTIVKMFRLADCQPSRPQPLNFSKLKFLLIGLSTRFQKSTSNSYFFSYINSSCLLCTKLAFFAKSYQRHRLWAHLNPTLCKILPLLNHISLQNHNCILGLL